MTNRGQIGGAATLVTGEVSLADGTRVTIDDGAAVRFVDENGVAYGLNRAYKHIDNPTTEQIAEKIRQAIMREICEFFEFEPRGGE